tara:strand:+ start:1079 stop:1303 length:225 start_codon:yes stop_codon:yes gene_type:complete
LKKIKKITILGTGNIANQYCGLFLKNNFEIDCIYGNNEKNVAKEILDKSIFTLIFLNYLMIVIYTLQLLAMMFI